MKDDLLIDMIAKDQYQYAMSSSIQERVLQYKELIEASRRSKKRLGDKCDN